MFYFERKTDREPIGVIILEGCTIELAEDDQERYVVPELYLKMYFISNNDFVSLIGQIC